MTENLKGQPVCVITGGTSGVGRAAFELFAQNNYRLATCGRNPERLEQLRHDLQTSSERHLVQQVDLADVKQTQDFGDAILNKFRRVDVLINNAATTPLAPFEQIEHDVFEQTLNVNIRSTFYLTQKIWAQMQQQGRGVVVNISSLAAIDPFPGFSIYGASKAWIDLLTQALAPEGAEHGIRIYSLRAGAIETPLLRRLFPDFPAEQCVSPEIVAQTVLKCVNNEPQFESGKHYVVTNQT